MKSKQPFQHEIDRAAKLLGADNDPKAVAWIKNNPRLILECIKEEDNEHQFGYRRVPLEALSEEALDERFRTWQEECGALPKKARSGIQRVSAAERGALFLRSHQDFKRLGSWLGAFTATAPHDRVVLTRAEHDATIAKLFQEVEDFYLLLRRRFPLRSHFDEVLSSWTAPMDQRPILRELLPLGLTGNELVSRLLERVGEPFPCPVSLRELFNQAAQIGSRLPRLLDLPPERGRKVRVGETSNVLSLRVDLTFRLHPVHTFMGIPGSRRKEVDLVDPIYLELVYSHHNTPARTQQAVRSVLGHLFDRSPEAIREAVKRAKKYKLCELDKQSA
jgi:hypothetical protein